MFNKPLQQKYGRQRKLNYWYTSIPSISIQLGKKVELIAKHRNCGLVRGWSCVEHSVAMETITWCGLRPTTTILDI